MTPATEAIGMDTMPVPDSELSAECDRWITFIQNAAIHDVSAWSHIMRLGRFVPSSPMPAAIHPAATTLVLQ